jgi:hypothetical protein
MGDIASWRAQDVHDNDSGLALRIRACADYCRPISCVALPAVL